MNHILSITDPELTWCGKKPAVNEFIFKTLEQASFNGLFTPERKACPVCTVRVIKTFLKNIEEETNHETTNPTNPRIPQD